MFNKECWWITGASSGIGEGLARALAARGASLVLSGRNVEALEAVARDCADALVLPFEATDFDLIPGIAERAWAWKGRVHGLVNNAGISQRSLAVETGFAVYRKMISVDLLAPIALTQALLPRMVQAGGGRSRRDFQCRGHRGRATALGVLCGQAWADRLPRLGAGRERASRDPGSCRRSGFDQDRRVEECAHRRWLEARCQRCRDRQRHVAGRGRRGDPGRNRGRPARTPVGNGSGA